MSRKKGHADDCRYKAYPLSTGFRKWIVRQCTAPILPCFIYKPGALIR